MKLLIDANLSPRVATALRVAGHTAVHVADIGLLDASDSEIFDRAAEDGYVVTQSPSVVHLRHVAELTYEVHMSRI